MSIVPLSVLNQHWLSGRGLDLTDLMNTLNCLIIIQSILVISNSKGLSEILRDIRTSTYQICRIKEKIIRKTIFNKFICNWTLELRNTSIEKIMWKRGEIWSNFSSFPHYFSPVVRFSCLDRDKIFTSR